MANRLARGLLRGFAGMLPPEARRTLLVYIGLADPEALREALWPRLARGRVLDAMAVDLEPPPAETLGFEHLVGLFSSTSLDHAVISMPVRQAGYLFGLIRACQPRTVIEVGRYRGGSTVVIAAALRGQGEFWSIDLGVDETPARRADAGRPYDEQVRAFLDRLDLRANLLVGDSRTMPVPAKDVDLTLIDGDHTYEGARIDLERFGRNVRVGGALLLDDVFDDGFFPHRTPGVTRACDELLRSGDFRLVRRVNRLAHLERVR